MYQNLPFSFQFWEIFKNISGGCFFKISNLVTKTLFYSEKKLKNNKGVLWGRGGGPDKQGCRKFFQKTIGVWTRYAGPNIMSLNPDTVVN